MSEISTTKTLQLQAFLIPCRQVKKGVPFLPASCRLPRGIATISQASLFPDRNSVTPQELLEIAPARLLLLFGLS